MKDIVTKSIENRLDILKNNFPECFDREGNLIINKLQEIINPDKKAFRDSYGLNWLGKSYAKHLVNVPINSVLEEDEEHNRLPENEKSENLYIKGDNLEVIKHLLNAYSGEIKMIYIDPPYNTKSGEFVYNDDRNFSEKELVELYEKGIIDEVEKDDILKWSGKNSSHSAWLTFMYPRLYLARKLLKEDGVIFISIDDNEVNQLKLMCDEIFGEENFVANFVWQKKTGASDAVGISTITESILTYTKNIKFADEIFSKNMDSFDINRYKEKDDYYDYRGPYYTDNLDRGGLQYSDSMNFGILCPDGSYTFPNGRTEFLNDGWTWKWGKEKIEWAIENEFLEIKKSSNKASGWAVYYKNYLHVDNENKPILRSAPFKNLITAITNESSPDKIKEILIKFIKNKKNDINFIMNVFSGISDIIDENDNREEQLKNNLITSFLNADSSQVMKNIFTENLFPYSKPIKLLKFLVNLINKNDIILDFFSGSATTAHAVMELNKEDNKNRKYIMVQIEEDIDVKKNPKAYEFCRKNELPTNITSLGIERIKRAAKLIENKEDIDCGFKIYSVRDIPNKLLIEKEFNPNQQIFMKNEDILEDKEKNSLLNTFKVYDGKMLTEKIKEVSFDNYKGYLIGDILYFMDTIDSSNIVKLLLEKIDNDKAFIIKKIVVYGYTNQNAQYRKELIENVKNYNNKKSANIDIEVRY